MNSFNPKEFKVTALRECPVPAEMLHCDTPDKAVEYWRLHVATDVRFNPECECFVVLLLNTRRRVKGHQLVTIGTMDTMLVHAREVFRLAVVASAAAIVLMHNHPSGEPEPSQADRALTKTLAEALALVDVSVLDHFIVAPGASLSFAEQGLMQF